MRSFCRIGTALGCIPTLQINGKQITVTESSVHAATLGSELNVVSPSSSKCPSAQLRVPASLTTSHTAQALLFVISSNKSESSV